MNYKKLIGFGILIWVTAFVTASLFVAFNKIDSIAAKIIVPLAVGTAVFFVSKNLNLNSTKSAFKYSAAWIIIGLLLDVVITVPFTGWEIFTKWNVWLGYFLILIVPVLTAYGKKSV